MGNNESFKHAVDYTARKCGKTSRLVEFSRNFGKNADEHKDKSTAKPWELGDEGYDCE